jgi:hypothetical protein
MSEPPQLLDGTPRRDTLSVLRCALLVIVLTGFIGTGIELILLEHTDGFWQWLPVAQIGLALIILAWFAVERGARSLNAFRGMMVLFLVSGAVGLALHYKGNVEFELEMSPALHGWELFKKAMMGATPALAPGTMFQLGLVGLAWTFRHPTLGRRRDLTSVTE